MRDLRAGVRTQQFNTWFTHLTPKGLEDDVLVIEAPNDFNREWIEKNYADAIREAVNSTLCAGSDDAVDIQLVTKAG